MAKIDEREQTREAVDATAIKPNNIAGTIPALPEVNALEDMELDVSPDNLKKIKQILSGSERVGISLGNSECVQENLLVASGPPPEPPYPIVSDVNQKKIILRLRNQLKPEVVQKTGIARQCVFAIFEGKLKAAQTAFEQHTSDGIIRRPFPPISNGLPLVLSPEQGDELFAMALTELRGSVGAWASGDYTSALNGLHWSIVFSPTFSAYICRAGIHYERGVFGACIADCTSALEFAPDDVLALAQRALANARIGRHRAAFEDATLASLVPARAETTPPGNSSGLETRQRREMAQALRRLLSAEHRWARWIAPAQRRAGPRNPSSLQRRAKFVRSLRSTYIPISARMKVLRAAGRVVVLSNLGAVPAPSGRGENLKEGGLAAVNATKNTQTEVSPPNIGAQVSPPNAGDITALTRLFSCIALPTPSIPDSN